MTGICLSMQFLFVCETHEFVAQGLLVPETVTESPVLKSIYINGTDLHTQTFGNKSDPMMVVIHGGPDGDYRCVLNFRDLAGYRMFVVFYDQRRSGFSIFQGTPYLCANSIFCTQLSI
jgi:proline iminopeptidase